MALKDISIQEISSIVANLSFPALVDPFRKNGVSGKAIARISSYQDIMDITNNQISKVVAETFFEDYVLEWKTSGLVPKELLNRSSNTVLRPPIASESIPVPLASTASASLGQGGLVVATISSSSSSAAAPSIRATTSSSPPHQETSILKEATVTVVEEIEPLSASSSSCTPLAAVVQVRGGSNIDDIFPAEISSQSVADDPVSKLEARQLFLKSYIGLSEFYYYFSLGLQQHNLGSWEKYT